MDRILIAVAGVILGTAAVVILASVLEQIVSALVRRKRGRCADADRGEALRDDGEIREWTKPS
jgi:hypothetical protein